MVAGRRDRLMQAQCNEHLASLTRRDDERFDESRQLPIQAAPPGHAQAATSASTEAQAERANQQQERQHAHTSGRHATRRKPQTSTGRTRNNTGRNTTDIQRTKV